MYKLVLIRHGESTWNLENRFTGWTDVDLTPTGIEQAKAEPRNAGKSDEILAKASEGRLRKEFFGSVVLMAQVFVIDGKATVSDVCAAAEAVVRDRDDLANFSAHPAARELCAMGPITPDHVIRTKGRYLFVDRAAQADRAALERALVDYAAWYRRYFETAVKPLGRSQMLHPIITSRHAQVAEACRRNGVARSLAAG